MNFVDAQARMLAEDHERMRALRRENARLRWIVAVLLIVGTVQWLAGLLG